MKCEVYVEGVHLEQVSEFKYLQCVLDGAECSRKVAGAFRSLVNGRDLHIEYASLG